MVSTGSDPQRGSISITAGKRYYGTKAIHILDEGVQDAIAPVSFAGTYFGNTHTRNDPKIVNIYAPQDDITVSVYENVVGGVTGTATSIFSVSRGSSDTYVTTAVQNVWMILKTDKPAIMTVGSGADDHLMQPMTNYVYKRRNQASRTINNTEPSNLATYVSYDTSLPLLTLEIADGAGGDSTQGIGYEYLQDTFYWGNVLSDYQIVAPYADTTVTVSYWANSQWNVGEVHSLNGTQTNPDAVDRDGTNGFGVDGTNISGAAANLASGANLWKFEGTQPFSVIINDTADDEERLLGWMSNKTLRTSSNVTQSFVNLIDKDDRSRMKIYGKDLTTTAEYAGAKLSAGDYIEFDGTNDYVSFTSNPSLTNQITVDVLVNLTATTPNGNGWILGREGSYRLTYASSSFKWVCATVNNGWYTEGTPVGANLTTTNSIINVVGTYDGSNNRIYVNGILIITAGSAISGNILTTGNYYLVRSDAENIDYGKLNMYSHKIYNRALSAQEIQQNFIATRSRFSI